MDHKEHQPERREDTHASDTGGTAANRKDWQEPKLTFIEPVLLPHGDLTKVTEQFGGFFGAFSPVIDE